MKILIADDNDQNLYLLQMILQGHGFEVLSAHNGAEALALAHQDGVDMIVTDILMPVMDGFSLCREWKKDPLLQNIPFIFYTATYTDLKDEKFALSLGADRFIIKPAEPDILMNILNEVIADYRSGQLALEQQSPASDADYLQNYNDALIRKLHSKIEQLERSNHALEQEIIERQLAEEAEREQRTFAMALVKTVEVINYTLEFDEVLEAILSVVADVVPHDGANIMLINDKRTAVHIVGACDCYVENNLPKPHIGLSWQLDELTYLRQMIKIQKGVVIADTYADPNWIHKETAVPIRSYASAPIIIDGQVMGFLNVDSVTPNFFTPSHVEHLQAFANQAAIAVRNAQMFHKVSSYNEALEQAVAERTTELTAANVELQKLSRVKDEFVSNVSHELKTPITSLMLHHYRLRQNPEKLDKHLTVLERETRRLEHIVEDLLDLSLLDQGRTKVSFMPVDLNVMAANLVSDRIPQAQQKNIELSFVGASGLPTVRVDYGLLEQVLSILLTNALNYTPEGGQVIMRTLSLSQDWLACEVQDTGPGISEEDQQQLFNRFFRGKTGQQSGTSGTGLGLAIAKEIIDQHNGRIEVESTLGKGSLFRVVLPIQADTSLSPIVHIL